MDGCERGFAEDEAGQARVVKVRIVLVDDKSLTLAQTIERTRDAFYAAMEKGGWVEIEPVAGVRVMVNPAHVLYLEEVP